MPQAMPLNWMELYFFFSIIFILINIKMYFHFYQNSSKFKWSKKKLNHWKW